MQLIFRKNIKQKTSYLLAALFFFSTQSIASPILHPGKWVSNAEPGYFCIMSGNALPSADDLAIQEAASSSTGDGRWIGRCAIKNYKNSKDKFLATMSCSQTRTFNNKKVQTNPFSITGTIINSNKYVVKQNFRGPLNYDKIVITYRFISESCGPKKGFSSVSIKKPVEWNYLNPLYSYLIGLPGDAIYYYPK